MNSPEPAARRRIERSPARRIAAAVILSVLVFAVLWIMVFSMVTSLLIGAGCCVVIVAASSVSDLVDMLLDAVASVIFGVLAVDRGDLRGDFQPVRILGPPPGHPLVCGAVRIQLSNTLSSSGLTGRSSTPRLIDSTLASLEYWITPFAGDDSWVCVRVLAAKCARGLRNFRPHQKQRAQGKPGARCTRGLVCKVRKKTHTSIQVQRRHPGFPCAMGYGLLRALPGERLFCHRRPTRSLLPVNLTPAPRRQDHTTSPSASGANVSSRHSRPPHLTARS